MQNNNKGKQVWLYGSAGVTGECVAHSRNDWNPHSVDNNPNQTEKKTAKKNEKDNYKQFWLRRTYCKQTQRQPCGQTSRHDRWAGGLIERGDRDARLSDAPAS